MGGLGRTRTPEDRKKQLDEQRLNKQRAEAGDLYSFLINYSPYIIAIVVAVGLAANYTTFKELFFPEAGEGPQPPPRRRNLLAIEGPLRPAAAAEEAAGAEEAAALEAATL